MQAETEKNMGRHFTGALKLLQMKATKMLLQQKSQNQRKQMSQKNKYDFYYCDKSTNANEIMKSPKICERNNNFNNSFSTIKTKSSCVILPATHPKLLQKESK